MSDDIDVEEEREITRRMARSLANSIERSEKTRALAADMLAMLKRLEWMPWDGDGELYCPICELQKNQNHEPNCELNAIIKRGEVELLQ